MNHDHQLTTRRIESFSDGIFGLVATLLVLDLKLPDTMKIMTNQIALNTLFHLAPQFLSFALSFFIVCIFWVNHHQFFYSLKKADRKLLWLNNLLLFWLCFIPFPTAFLGRYPTNQVAVILFGGLLFLAAISFYALTYHAMLGSNLYDEHISLQERKRSQKRSSWGIYLYALSIILAPFSVYLSLFIFIIVPLIYFVPRRIQFS